MPTALRPDADGQDNVYSTLNDNFLFAEDNALKTWLKGMNVSDDKNANRAVEVWFAMPDMELRDQKFPFIVLELISVIEAKERELRGLLKVGNDPGASVGYTPGTYRYAMEPLPINLVYQAAAYSRHPRHNRQIIRQMLSGKLPGRLAALPVPEDGTKRHMELLSWTSRDVVEGGRKLWQSVFTISVTSEISDIETAASAPPAGTVEIITLALPATTP